MTLTKTENSSAVALAHIGHDAILDNKTLELISIMSLPSGWRDGDGPTIEVYDEVINTRVRHAARCANVIIQLTETLDALKKAKGIA